MPTLNWIGRKAVENHHRQVPFHLLGKGLFIMPQGKDWGAIRSKIDANTK